MVPFINGSDSGDILLGAEVLQRINKVKNTRRLPRTRVIAIGETENFDSCSLQLNVFQLSHENSILFLSPQLTINYFNDSILIFPALNLLCLLYFILGSYNESKAVRVRPSSPTSPRRFWDWLRFGRTIRNRDLWKCSLSGWKPTMWHLSFWIQAIGEKSEPFKEGNVL